MKSTAGKAKVAASCSLNFSILNDPWVFFRTNVPPECSVTIVQVISTLSPQLTSGEGLKVIWGFCSAPEIDNKYQLLHCIIHISAKQFHSQIHNEPHLNR